MLNDLQGGGKWAKGLGETREDSLSQLSGPSSQEEAQ